MGMKKRLACALNKEEEPVSMPTCMPHSENIRGRKPKILSPTPFCPYLLSSLSMAAFYNQYERKKEERKRDIPSKAGNP